MKRTLHPETGGTSPVFAYSGRYDPELPGARTRAIWERYWSHLDLIGVARRSQLDSFFVADVFQGGRISVQGLSLSRGELRLIVENTHAMNQIHELCGDEWARLHIRRRDFSTTVTFAGVEFFVAELGDGPGERYYRYSEIGSWRDRLQIAVALTQQGPAMAYFQCSFRTVSVQDISHKIRRYETGGRVKIILPGNSARRPG